MIKDKEIINEYFNKHYPIKRKYIYNEFDVGLATSVDSFITGGLVGLAVLVLIGLFKLLSLNKVVVANGIYDDKQYSTGTRSVNSLSNLISGSKNINPEFKAGLTEDLNSYKNDREKLKQLIIKRDADLNDIFNYITENVEKIGTDEQKAAIIEIFELIKKSKEEKDFADANSASRKGVIEALKTLKKVVKKDLKLENSGEINKKIDVVIESFDTEDGFFTKIGKSIKSFFNRFFGSSSSNKEEEKERLKIYEEAKNQLGNLLNQNPGDLPRRADECLKADQLYFLVSFNQDKFRIENIAPDFMEESKANFIYYKKDNVLIIIDDKNYQVYIDYRSESLQVLFDSNDPFSKLPKNKLIIPIGQARNEQIPIVIVNGNPDDTFNQGEIGPNKNDKQEQRILIKFDPYQADGGSDEKTAAYIEYVVGNAEEDNGYYLFYPTTPDRTFIPDETQSYFISKVDGVTSVEEDLIRLLITTIDQYSAIITKKDVPEAERVSKKPKDSNQNSNQNASDSSSNSTSPGSSDSSGKKNNTLLFVNGKYNEMDSDYYNKQDETINLQKFIDNRQKPLQLIENIFLNKVQTKALETNNSNNTPENNSSDNDQAISETLYFSFLDEDSGKIKLETDKRNALYKITVKGDIVEFIVNATSNNLNKFESIFNDEKNTRIFWDKLFDTEGEFSKLDIKDFKIIKPGTLKKDGDDWIFKTKGEILFNPDEQVDTSIVPNIDEKIGDIIYYRTNPNDPTKEDSDDAYYRLWQQGSNTYFSQMNPKKLTDPKYIEYFEKEVRSGNSYKTFNWKNIPTLDLAFLKNKKITELKNISPMTYKKVGENLTMVIEGEMEISYSEIAVESKIYSNKKLKNIINEMFFNEIKSKKRYFNYFEAIDLTDYIPVLKKIKGNQVITFKIPKIIKISDIKNFQPSNIYYLNLESDKFSKIEKFYEFKINDLNNSIVFYQKQNEDKHVGQVYLDFSKIEKDSDIYKNLLKYFDEEKEESPTIQTSSFDSLSNAFKKIFFENNGLNQDFVGQIKKEDRKTLKQNFFSGQPVEIEVKDDFLGSISFGVTKKGIISKDKLKREKEKNPKIEEDLEKAKADLGQDVSSIDLDSFILQNKITNSDKNSLKIVSKQNKYFLRFDLSSDDIKGLKNNPDFITKNNGKDKLSDIIDIIQEANEEYQPIKFDIEISEYVLNDNKISFKISKDNYIQILNKINDSSKQEEENKDNEQKNVKTEITLQLDPIFFFKDYSLVKNEENKLTLIKKDKDYFLKFDLDSNDVKKINELEEFKELIKTNFEKEIIVEQEEQKSDENINEKKYINLSIEIPVTYESGDGKEKIKISPNEFKKLLEAIQFSFKEIFNREKAFNFYKQTIDDDFKNSTTNNLSYNILKGLDHYLNDKLNKEDRLYNNINRIFLGKKDNVKSVLQLLKNYIIKEYTIESNLYKNLLEFAKKNDMRFFISDSGKVPEETQKEVTEGDLLFLSLKTIVVGSNILSNEIDQLEEYGIIFKRKEKDKNIYNGSLWAKNGNIKNIDFKEILKLQEYFNVSIDDYILNEVFELKNYAKDFVSDFNLTVTINKISDNYVISSVTVKGNLNQQKNAELIKAKQDLLASEIGIKKEVGRKGNVTNFIKYNEKKKEVYKKYGLKDTTEIAARSEVVTETTGIIYGKAKGKLGLQLIKNAQKITNIKNKGDDFKLYYFIKISDKYYYIDINDKIVNILTTIRSSKKIKHKKVPVNLSDNELDLIKNDIILFKKVYKFDAKTIIKLDQINFGLISETPKTKDGKMLFKYPTSEVEKPKISEQPGAEEEASSDANTKSDTETLNSSYDFENSFDSMIINEAFKNWKR
jgi:hypothetical protein